MEIDSVAFNIFLKGFFKMSYKYDYLTFIGRMEPVHIGHIEVILTALTMSHNVIVLIGSSNQPRTIKNPWTYQERFDMIFNALPPDVRDRVFIRPLRDQKYNDAKWAVSVQAIVSSIVDPNKPKIGKARIGVIGHSKDDSSYYLKMFPQWGKPIEHPMNEVVNATDIRNIYFEQKNIKFLSGLLPNSSYDQLKSFMNSDEYANLVIEHKHIKKYKKAWEAAPYAPTFVTTDAIVVQSGHVLLIKRKAAPGFNLMALPGGFLEQKEHIIDGMLRELREETKLKVPEAVLRGSIKHIQVFDDPNRSMRGRTITHAFLIVLPDGDLPHVKGGSDASLAEFIAISDVAEDKCFEDHYHIIDHMIGFM